MTRIAPQDHEPVKIHPRQHLTIGQKVTRHEQLGGLCTICRMSCAAFGPTVIWDHRLPLELGGTNDLSNFEPNHAKLCANIKTALDRKAIAKAKRLAGETCTGETKRPLQGRGFDKTKSRKFNGTVVPRSSGEMDL